MDNKSDGGPAFPGNTSPLAADVRRVRDDLGIGLHDARELISYSGGMTLRDWFAGQALNGAISSRDQWSALMADRGEVHPGEYVAAFAYATADAMLAAREVRS